MLMQLQWCSEEPSGPGVAMLAGDGGYTQNITFNKLVNTNHVAEQLANAN